MKALIINSIIESEMEGSPSNQPKCMTEISFQETILSRQLKQVLDIGIEEVIITTSNKKDSLICYCQGLDLPLKISFVVVPLLDQIDYLFDIYCAREYLNDDILIFSGDMVFENEVIDRVFKSPDSCVTDSMQPFTGKKDLVRSGESNFATEIGIDDLKELLKGPSLYKIRKGDLHTLLNSIIAFYKKKESSEKDEDRFLEEVQTVFVLFLDVQNLLCTRIDSLEDLAVVKTELKKIESKTVYMCFSTDFIHGGHIAIIKKAQRLGKLIIGVLSDEAVSTYKRLPLVPASERKVMFENVTGVYKVVDQNTLSYKENLEKYKPAIVVHGDDWCNGFQKPIRDEVVSVLATYGGKLVEYPYSNDQKYTDIQARTRADLAMPDIRRGRLRKVLETKQLITAMEAHDGLTGLIVENTVVPQEGGAHQFDAIWVSSLCDSTAKGKPDIELVDMTSRFRTIEDISEVTTKPIIFDGDTGGKTEHFVYTVRSLERLGVSMIIIEDKTGLKKNSLFGTEVVQTQDSIENFSAKIRAGKKAQRTKEFMICARIESLILEQGMEDALSRAAAFTEAGADAIMIHSRKKDPSEILEFIRKFRLKDTITPIVLVPTSFNSVTEEEWKKYGANIVIYANQLMRAEVPAMQKAAKVILENHRAEECDAMLMPFEEIIRLIPEDVL